MKVYLFIGFKGEVGFEEEHKNVELEICHEGRSLDDSEELITVLFDLKKGKPLSGESLAIKYDLVRSWNTKVNITNKPVIKDGCKGSNDLGIINSKLLKLKKAIIKEKSIQYRAFRISFEDKIISSLKTNSLCFINSPKFSHVVPKKGLVLTTTILATTVKIKNAIKAKTKLNTATILEITSGASHSPKIVSLFLVQYAFLEATVIGICFICMSIIHRSISLNLSKSFFKSRPCSRSLSYFLPFHPHPQEIVHAHL